MSSAPHPIPPPRAFTQGVGTVYQGVGVTLFLVFTFACCVTAFRSENTSSAERVGAGAATRAAGTVPPAEREWVVRTVFAGMILGMGLAGIGLGLQSHRRAAAWAAAAVTGPAAALWAWQAGTAAWRLHWYGLSLFCALLALIFLALWGLGIGAVRDVAKNPPPADQSLSAAELAMLTSGGAGADESPEAALARELAQRKQRLEVEQKELEALERRLRYKREGM